MVCVGTDERDARIVHKNFRRLSSESSMAKHKEFMLQLPAIVRHAKAFKKGETMAEFNIKCDSTYDRLIQRAKEMGLWKDTPQTAISTDRSLYPDAESYYDGLVRAILRKIQDSEYKFQLAWAAFLYEKEKNKLLEEERKSWRLTAKGVEKEVVIDLLGLVNTT